MSKVPAKKFSYDNFIIEARKNGYFDRIKQVGSQDIGFQNKADATYRSNVRTHYANKLKKPFKLMEQPEYKRQRRFFSNFNDFVESLSEFEKIANEPVKKHVNLEKKILNQVFSTTLLHDPTYISEMSPEKIAQRQKKPKFSLTERTLFPTKVNYQSETKNQQKYRDRSQTLNLYSNSPLKSPRKGVKKSSRELSLEKSQASRRLDEVKVLQNLNKILGTEHKKINFRVSKLKFHDMLVNKFGNQVITNFFSLQNVQNFQGILQLISQLLNASQKLINLITFLTFDVDQNGIISESDLMFLMNNIPTNSPLLTDIYVLTSQLNNSQSDCQVDLPISFLKKPTYSDFLKASRMNEVKAIDKRMGVFRLFSLKQENEEENKEEAGSQVDRSEEEKMKKQKIKINWKKFQTIFSNGKKPKFVLDLCMFLIGSEESIEKEEKKNEETSETLKKLKKSPSKKEGESPLKNPREVIKVLKKESKTFSTISYK